MPRLISELNSGGGAIGISSDGIELGNMKKLDYESWNDKYIVEELAKKITYEYKEDTSDDIVDAVYRWREIHEQDVYKSHTEENDQKFRKEELTMGTKVFSSTIQFNSYGKQPTPSQTEPTATTLKGKAKGEGKEATKKRYNPFKDGRIPKGSDVGP